MDNDTDKKTGADFGNYWATYYSSIWSHCSQGILSDHTVLNEYLHILTAESVNGIEFVPAKWKRLIENARLNAIEIAR